MILNTNIENMRMHLELFSQSFNKLHEQKATLQQQLKERTINVENLESEVLV